MRQSPPVPSVPEPVPRAPSPDTATLERLIEMLQRELDAARERETQSLQLLAQMQQQNQRLLDMPRQAPPPRPPSPPRAPAASRPAAPLGDPRGDMRRRIVALLQEHPEGLTPAEMRTLLGVDKNLSDTCLGMLRDGLVQRVGRGRYVTMAAARPPA